MWMHKKFGRQVFKSSYEYTKKDRVFTLTHGKRIISFESWQAAKKQGWYKL